MAITSVVCGYCVSNININDCCFRVQNMKRIDQWKAKLRAAKSELRHKTRQLNAAQRTHTRTTKLIEQLEAKINAYKTTL